jgi:uncharacterized membrane protein YidH (DUF202 family)
VVADRADGPRCEPRRGPADPRAGERPQLALLGTGFIAYGAWRERAVRRSFEQGGFAYPDTRVFAALTTLAVLLGIATFVLVVAES